MELPWARATRLGMQPAESHEAHEALPLPARTVDSAEFERVALPWLDAVYRFARSLTHDASDADDLVQETFLRALRSWHTFRPEADCRRWLFAICHHAFLASRQRPDVRREHADTSEGDIDALPAVMLHHAAVRDGADELLARIGLGPALHDALAHLSDSFRTVVVLVDGEGHSYEEAAELLHVPVRTVRSRLFRARRSLQESLFAHARDAGLRCAAGPGASIISAPPRCRYPRGRKRAAIPRSRRPMAEQIAVLDCYAAMRQLWDYLDEALTDARSLAMRAHLLTCGECYGHYDFAKHFLDALETALAAECAPVALHARVRDTLRSDGFEPRYDEC